MPVRVLRRSAIGPRGKVVQLVAGCLRPALDAGEVPDVAHDEFSDGLREVGFRGNLLDPRSVIGNADARDGGAEPGLGRTGRSMFAGIGERRVRAAG
jgi:hypothetical protein